MKIIVAIIPTDLVTNLLLPSFCPFLQTNSYNVEILNTFNPELQLKETESAIKSKLIELLTQLKGFKFVTTLVLMFRKTESEDKFSFKLKSRNYCQ